MDYPIEHRPPRSCLFNTPTNSVEGTLTLLGIKGVGPRAVEHVVKRFKTLDAMSGASDRDLATVGNTRVQRALRDQDAIRRSREATLLTLEKLERLRINVLTLNDEEYPRHLRSIPDRPLVLYVKGKLAGPRTVACVGTREPSKYGEAVSRRISEMLAARGWSIVSGLALGCDSHSHEGALAASGHTVAILGGGLDNVYPAKNRRLAERILDSGGAVISEQPLGVPAVARNLVARDRLQSGMSVGTIVMQTAVKGGSMHTVRFTLMQGRLLFVPLPTGAHAEHPKSQGTLALCRRTGSDLRSILAASGDYARVLAETYSSRSPAIPITSRDDYARVLSLLDSRIDAAPGSQADSRPDVPSLFPDR